MGVSPSLSASSADVVGDRPQAGDSVNAITLPARKKSLADKSAGEAGRAAGGQHVRRSGHIIAHGHRDCNGPKTRLRHCGIFSNSRSASAEAMCKCSGAIWSASAAASSAESHQDQRPELLQALPSQVAALQMGQLRRQARRPRRPTVSGSR